MGGGEAVKVFVPLTAAEFERLVKLAQQERRLPRDQAAVLLARALGSEEEEETQEKPAAERMAVA